jgi:hypothetical protein
MTTPTIGLLLGAVLGAVLVLDGLGSMLVVALAAAIGWVVGRVVDGELDLTAYLGGDRERGR